MSQDGNQESQTPNMGQKKLPAAIVEMSENYEETNKKSKEIFDRDSFKSQSLNSTPLQSLESEESTVMR